MSWHTDKLPSYQDRLDQLTVKYQTIQSKIETIKSDLKNYVNHGGVTQDPINPDFNDIKTNVESIQSIANSYKVLYDDIHTFLYQEAQRLDLSGSLADSVTLETSIARLEKQNKELNVDVETAVARDELLRSRETKGNSHHLFLMDRPIRKQMIPYAWVLSILFIGIGLLIIKTYMPTYEPIVESYSEYIKEVIGEFIMNPLVLMALLGVTIVIIIFLALKIGNVI